MPIHPVLPAARHGLGVHRIRLVAGEVAIRDGFPGGPMVGAAAAVHALAVQGCLLHCVASHLVPPERAPGRLTAQVRLTPAALEAVVATGTGGAADGFAVVPAAPALHLTVRAEASIVCLSFKGPVVHLKGEETGNKTIKRGLK